MSLRGFLVVSALSLLGAAPPPDTVVHYSLSPVVENGDLTSLAVELRFTGDADGETRLMLPDEWGGKTELWWQVRDLSIEAHHRAQLGQCLPPRGQQVQPRQQTRSSGAS